MKKKDFSKLKLKKQNISKLNEVQNIKGGNPLTPITTIVSRMVCTTVTITIPAPPDDDIPQETGRPCDESIKICV